VVMLLVNERHLDFVLMLFKRFVQCLGCVNSGIAPPKTTIFFLFIVLPFLRKQGFDPAKCS